MGIPMLKIRRSRLIFNMGIIILVSRHLYFETGPRCLSGVMQPAGEVTYIRIFRFAINYLFDDLSHVRRHVVNCTGSALK